ncbi:hypothetical protein TWF694_007170 [Orbilia ellipsospora]|uniref:Uncharacterized protein n=1 Tax=Orbilia ellipsospora TaxID=2528407 RepID=A0AAV9XIJ3_9PEZI
MHFSTISTFALLATMATAFPHLRRQDTPTNGTVEAPAIGISMGCTVMANACRYYIKSTPCTDEWVVDVKKCIPATCSGLRDLAMKPCAASEETPQPEKVDIPPMYRW